MDNVIRDSTYRILGSNTMSFRSLNAGYRYAMPLNKPNIVEYPVGISFRIACNTRTVAKYLVVFGDNVLWL